MNRPTLLDRLEAAQDPAASLDLLKRAVGRESVTGNEADFVDLLRHEMQARNLAPNRADFLPGRPNIWGARQGVGGGPRLQFIGHTDTVHATGWAEAWAGTARADPFAATLVDGAVWGRGVADLKGGICAVLASLDLLDRADLRLCGDLAFAFVGDEESGEPGTGVSAGIRDWSGRVRDGAIPSPDFAIYMEPTGLALYTAQIGFYIAEVTVTGRAAYFGRPEQGVDALRAAHRILASLWDHVDALEALPGHDLVGRRSILVTALRGGGSVAVPHECRFSVIGTLLPGDTLDDAVAGFETAVRSAPVHADITVEITYPAGRDHRFGGSPIEIDPGLPAVTQLQQAVGDVLPGRGEIAGAPYWSESPFLVERLGCPTVYCAAGDIAHCHTTGERLEVSDYLASIVAFALFAARYCGVEGINQSKEGDLS